MASLWSRTFQEGRWNFEVIAAALCNLCCFPPANSKCNSKKKWGSVIFTYLFILALYWSSSKLSWREKKFLKSECLFYCYHSNKACVLSVSLKHFAKAWQLQNLLFLSCLFVRRRKVRLEALFIKMIWKIAKSGLHRCPRSTNPKCKMEIASCW